MTARNSSRPLPARQSVHLITRPTARSPPALRLPLRGELRQAATLLTQAAALAPDAGLRNYLELRADALTSDDYRASDMAWLDMKDNRIDLVIGPIETYEDRLFGYKAAYEAYVLVKDMAWSKRLARYAAMLPDLQRGLPVPAAYKAEAAGSDSDLNAYDVIYYAGDCNAGSKTIAINLPNDEQVRSPRERGALKLRTPCSQVEKILGPIAAELIAEDQRGHIHHSTPSSPTRCSTRWRTGSVFKNPSTARARFARRSRIAPAPRGRQGGRARSLHDHETPRARRARGQPRGLLRHLSRRQFRSVRWRRVRTRRGQHGALQLFREHGAFARDAVRRTLSRRHDPDAPGGSTGCPG